AVRRRPMLGLPVTERQRLLEEQTRGVVLRRAAGAGEQREHATARAAAQGKAPPAPPRAIEAPYRATSAERSHRVRFLHGLTPLAHASPLSRGRLGCRPVRAQQATIRSDVFCGRRRTPLGAPG